MKHKPKRATRTSAKVQTFAEQLAAEIGGVLDEHVDDLLDRARAYAIDGLRADIAIRQVAEEPAPDDEPEPDPEPDQDEDEPAPRPRTKAPGVPTCSKCGQPGHNARSCGREPKGGKSSPQPTTTTDRRDAIAKRAGSMPSPSFTADL